MVGRPAIYRKGVNLHLSNPLLQVFQFISLAFCSPFLCLQGDGRGYNGISFGEGWRMTGVCIWLLGIGCALQRKKGNRIAQNAAHE